MNCNNTFLCITPLLQYTVQCSCTIQSTILYTLKVNWANRNPKNKLYSIKYCTKLFLICESSKPMPIILHFFWLETCFKVSFYSYSLSECWPVFKICHFFLGSSFFSVQNLEYGDRFNIYSQIHQIFNIYIFHEIRSKMQQIYEKIYITTKFSYFTIYTIYVLCTMWTNLLEGTMG